MNILNTIERILRLLKDKKITEKEFVQDIGLNRSAFTDWKSGKSQSYKRHADKIADYFNVSTDYLLCKTDDPTPPDKKHIQPDIDDDDDPEIVTIQRLRKNMGPVDREKMMKLLRITFDELFPKDKNEDKDNDVQK